MNNKNEYINYPTIANLSLQDKNDYRLSHISVIDLLKEIESLKESDKKLAIIIQNQQKQIDALNEYLRSYIKSSQNKIDTLEKLVQSYTKTTADSTNKNIQDTKPKFSQNMLRSKTYESKIKIGDIITFGKYQGQTIEWIVLDKNGNLVLLISKYLLMEKKYNEKRTDVMWETCTLRTYLNDDFYNNVFTSEEQSKIATSTVVNSDNPHHGTKGGNDTEDKLFLLSVDELNSYFGLAEERKSIYTNGKKDWYWLRSPGLSTFDAIFVHEDGDVNLDGYFVDQTIGIRPALWVNL